MSLRAGATMSRPEITTSFLVHAGMTVRGIAAVAATVIILGSAAGCAPGGSHAPDHATRASATSALSSRTAVDSAAASSLSASAASAVAAASSAAASSAAARSAAAAASSAAAHSSAARAAAAASARAAQARAAAQASAAASQAPDCTPGYDPCIPPGDDVDCAGGSGNGPRYVEGPITVTGSDPYGLDRDHDGIGCESN